MKVLVLLSLLAFAYARNVEPLTPVELAEPLSAYGYIQDYAIPLAEEIRQAEAKYAQERIVGGSPAAVGQFPYQAGLLAEYQNVAGTGVCGGSLVSANRVITAAHCWFDGRNQAWRLTVVLGSELLFSGGNRILTSDVILHPNWGPITIRNDVAVIYLPENVAFTNVISPIALPSGAELNQNFVGVVGVASGFGLTSDSGSITTGQFLSHVNLNVISNDICRISFPLNLRSSNICTSGLRGTSTCRGDSGGPLAVISNNRPVLIGITSFGSGLGCQVGFPAVFARVTSFMDFFNQHIV